MSRFNWTCPYCNKAQSINSDDNSEFRERTMVLWEEDDGHYDVHFFSIKCRNDECGKFVLRAYFEVGETRILSGSMTNALVNANTGRAFELKPDSNAKPQPSYIPHFLIEDYQEACRIKNLSPKASAALCRRCLQGMIRHYWSVNEKTLYDEISAIEERCDPDVWQGIDAIRSVGNIGAHMQKDVNLIIDVDADEAQILIELIEQLFEDWYVTSHKRQARLDAAKRLRDAKNAQKDGKKSEENNAQTDKSATS